MRVVVTGASGFAGRKVCERLARDGFNVRVVGRKRPEALSTLYEVAEVADPTQGDAWGPAMAGADLVVHLAARAHVMGDDPVAAERLYHEANVAVTEAAATAAARAGVKRFVLVSSIKVNGERTGDTPFRASDPPAPEDAYGRSKLAAERQLKALAEGLFETVIIRPPLMHGVGVRGNLARLFAAVERGVPLPLKSIDNKRDLLSLNNFASLVSTAVMHPAAAGGTFLARDGKPISTADLVRAIGIASGRPARLIPVPPKWLARAAKLAGFDAEAARMIGNLEVDDAHTRQLLGWTAEETLDQSLAAAARWLKQQSEDAPQ